MAAGAAAAAVLLLLALAAAVGNSCSSAGNVITPHATHSRQKVLRPGSGAFATGDAARTVAPPGCPGRVTAHVYHT